MSLLDRLKGALEGIVRTAVAQHDFYAEYSCKVVSQDGDGNLDLEPDDPRIPGMQGIPIRYGIPGVTVKVSGGARVHVGWENGDPKKPYAAIWEPSSLLSLTVTAATKIVLDCSNVELCDGAGMPIARRGDMVMVTSTPPGLPAYGSIVTGQPKVKA